MEFCLFISILMQGIAKSIHRKYTFDETTFKIKSSSEKPLMMAAQHKDCDIAILALLNHGADPNIVDYNVSPPGIPRSVGDHMEINYLIVIL